MMSETETARRARAALAAQLTGRTNRLFYVVVLVVALVGSSTAAREWLIGDPKTGETASWWFLPLALVAVAVYELGAVAVSRFADQRRQLGERALLARTASAGLAGGAIAAQFLGHDNTGPAVFFAGVSLTGYVIYLLEAGASRRDAMRRDGKLADTPPAYGWTQWGRHPWLTRRARALALANAELRLQDKTLASLGRVASLAAAAEQVRAEKRLAAISDALRARITAGVDPTMAKIAVNTYSLPRVAEGIAAAADYPALTAIITSELVPARLVNLGDAQSTPPAPVVAEDQGATVAAAAIARHVTAEVAAATTEQPPAAAETAPVPAAIETETEATETETTAETTPVPPVRTEPARVPLTQLPPSLASIIVARPAAPAQPVAEPETTPVPPAAEPETEPAEAETAPVPPAPEKPADQGETDETAPETATTNGKDPLAGVEAKLLPYLRLVVAAHRDWAVAVKMPDRHPEALTVTKIKTAAKISGKALGCSIKTALGELAEHPETADAALRSHGLAAASAN